jgi:23S rRNA (uridine2552-2'-O)-methyltransferase
MSRSHSSSRWLSEHFSDPYVKRAQREGYRGRAAYKLIEIEQREKLLRPGMTVLDLGAAPGGWSQIAAERVGRSGRVIALDILPMEALAGVEVITGDFTDDAVFAALLKSLGGRAVNLVMSDMAPNMSGMTAVDQPRTLYLAELARDCALEVLVAGGDLLVKLFQGEGVEAFTRDLRGRFERVKFAKPKASRARSRELYALARGFKL